MLLTIIKSGQSVEIQWYFLSGLSLVVPGWLIIHGCCMCMCRRVKGGAAICEHVPTSTICSLTTDACIVLSPLHCSLILTQVIHSNFLHAQGAPSICMFSCTFTRTLSTFWGGRRIRMLSAGPVLCLGLVVHQRSVVSLLGVDDVAAWSTAPNLQRVSRISID
jgi:hypothetical protein